MSENDKIVWNPLKFPVFDLLDILKRGYHFTFDEKEIYAQFKEAGLIDSEDNCNLFQVSAWLTRKVS